jgi:hypothetical protein
VNSHGTLESGLKLINKNLYIKSYFEIFIPGNNKNTFEEKFHIL